VQSDGLLAIYRKNFTLAEGKIQDIYVDGAVVEGKPEAKGLSFYAILDRSAQLCNEDTLVLNVPICVFITGDHALHATVVGKEGMDKARCHWCKLPSSQWQTYGHAPGPKWTLQELKRGWLVL
jgi:hypothetical protein